MGLLIILIVTEVLTLIVIRQHFYTVSRVKYYISTIVNIILSLWLWILVIELYSYKGFFDTPEHIWMRMNLTGMMSAVIVPRIIIIFLHFSGKYTKRNTGNHIRWLTNTGLTIMISVLIIIALGTLHGRFNFKTENVTIKVKGLHKDLEGLKIVHLSDMHLAGFYHHSNLLQKVMEQINSYKPDLILNTGDFVNYGWREFDRNDTILSRLKSRYGNFAVLGNHDFGTYHPYFTEADIENNILLINQMLKASGHNVLNDQFTYVNVGKAKIAMIGIITMGSHPDIFHGDLRKAISELDSADLKILLSHDPNHWAKEVEGKTDIDITLSGHTHGMQMGIITKKFRWSPSKYFYPHWNGLYSAGEQYLYVNRGLGVLAIPFRIWMPPEITIITIMPE